MREGIAVHILKLKCRTMLSMKRFICTFCYKSIYFFIKEQLGKNVHPAKCFFFGFLIIEAGEACQKCRVYVTVKLLKLCICADILVTHVAVEECLLYTVCSFSFRCFVLPYNSHH